MLAVRVLRRISKINTTFPEFWRNLELLNILFFQLFILFNPKFQQILPDTADFVLATAQFQANSRLQGENHRAAELIAADPLNDGFTSNQPVCGGVSLLRERPLLADSGTSCR